MTTIKDLVRDALQDMTTYTIHLTTAGKVDTETLLKTRDKVLDELMEQIKYKYFS